MGGQFIQETWEARIPIKGKQEILNGILEGAQEVLRDSREIEKEITRKADANVERRLKSILDPNSTLILNAKKNPTSTGPYARVTEEEKKFILAELEMLRWTESNRKREENN